MVTLEPLGISQLADFENIYSDIDIQSGLNIWTSCDYIQMASCRTIRPIKWNKINVLGGKH